MENSLKKHIRDKILDECANSGLSKTEFAEKRLGIHKSWLSHLENKWDVPGVIGNDTWLLLEKHVVARTAYKGIATHNYIDVVRTCDRAYQSKRALIVIGEGGYGKTWALLSHKEKMEQEKKKVYYFDCSGITTRKKLTVGIMTAVGCYKEGTIANQLRMMADYLKGRNALLIIDETSALEGAKVTFLKDVMTVLRGVCGIILSGTPYLLKNIERGARNDRFLFSETKDRIFMIPTLLRAPEDDEAEAIFKVNGIEGKWLKILMGDLRGEHLKHFYWRNKPTFRGIADAIDMVRIAQMEERTINYLQEV